jgi:hypothetical protein
MLTGSLTLSVVDSCTYLKKQTLCTLYIYGGWFLPCICFFSREFAHYQCSLLVQDKNNLKFSIGFQIRRLLMKITISLNS